MSALLLRAALDLAAQGARILPLRLRLRSGQWKKIPVFKDWQAKATTDPALIEQWYDLNYPQDDVGVAMLANEHALIDVDSLQGHGTDGFITLKRLKARTGLKFDDAPSWLTQSNGNGFLYRLKQGQIVGSRSGRWGPVSIA